MIAKKQGDFSPCFIDRLYVLYLVDESRVHPGMQDFDRLHKLVNIIITNVSQSYPSLCKRCSLPAVLISHTFLPAVRRFRR